MENYFKLINLKIFPYLNDYNIIGDWGLEIGDWRLGIGPNPQSLIPIYLFYNKYIEIYFNYFL